MITEKCRTCQSLFEPKDWQIKKKDFLCNPCTRQYHKEYREKRKAAGNPVVSKKMAKEYFVKYNHEYNKKPEVRKKRAETSKNIYYSPDHAERIKARQLFKNSFRRGEILKGLCEICGAEKVDAHHDDYSKPLDVRWLCRAHHAEHHAKVKEQP